MRKLPKLIALVLCVMLVFCIVPLSAGAATNATSVSLSKSSVTLYANTSYRLTATIKPTTTTNPYVTWKSSNTAVATVDANGLVQPLKKGSATITATTSNGKKATCKVTVKAYTKTTMSAKVISGSSAYDVAHLYEFAEGWAVYQNGSGLYGFVSSSGKFIKAAYYDAKPFSNGLAAVKNKSGKWGFVNTSGKLVVSCKYADANSFSEGFAAVKNTSGKWGFINKTGGTAISFKYVSVMPDQGFVNNECAVSTAKNKWCYINHAGKATSKTYSVIALYSKTNEGYGRYETSKGFGYLNSNNKVAISASSARYLAEDFYQGFAEVDNSSGSGSFINTSGKVVASGFEYASSFHNGVASVIKDGKSYIMTTGLKLLGGAENAAVGDFSDGVATVATMDPTAKSFGYVGYIDVNCKTVKALGYVEEATSFEGAKAIALKNGKVYVLTVKKS